MLKYLIRSFFRSVTTKPKVNPPSRPVQKPNAPQITPKSKWPTTSLKPVEIQPPKPSLVTETTLTGKCYVVDGDTIRIGKVRLRLAGIDAPELEHPWGKKAKWELVHLCKGQTITAEIEPGMSYDRAVATCFLPDGRDLSAEMVKSGMALDWPKFSEGKYTHLEVEGARKKHWKAAAKQRGHMHIFNK